MKFRGSTYLLSWRIKGLKDVFVTELGLVDNWLSFCRFLLDSTL